MHTVYTVWGLGLGDDEDVWELCTVHASRAGAEAAREALLEGEVDWHVEVREHLVQP